jgi:hypothetical protein
MNKRQFGYSQQSNEIEMHRLTTGAGVGDIVRILRARLRSQICPSVQRTDFEVFKPGHAVGFGPQANFAGRSRKPPVGRDKKLPAVEKYREALVFRGDAEGVPCLARH